MLRDFVAFGNPGYRGGVRVSGSDVTGDGVSDIIAGSSVNGGLHVRVFDGATGERVHSFFAFESSDRGGVFVSAADLTGDGRAEIIVGAGAGRQAEIRIFDGATTSERRDSITPFGGFTGGVSVGAADINNDGQLDVIAAR